ncbi:hypothetical protein F66182_3291 [Fusarium sp. NRRL 66182]|nr:hypothetical protein F66182_3291 [Fusarium sp. NRRL 66182]
MEDSPSALSVKKQTTRNANIGTKAMKAAKHGFGIVVLYSPVRRIAISVDRVDEIFDRLETLESTFHTAIAGRRERSPVATPYPVSRHGGEAISPDGGVLAASSVHSAGPGTQTSLSQFANNNVFNTTMDIPLSHSSTTGNLLRSAPAKALLGHYPPDLFLHIELRRPVPEGLRLNAVPASQIDIPTLSHSETDHLVRNYFQLVHRFHPILDQRAFYELYDQTLDHVPMPTLASALVLVVLALGTVAAETPNRMDACWSPGIRYFTPAVRLLLTESLCSFGGNPILPQALYLAALYYSYLSRPLLAWRLVHMASTDVQHYWIRSEKLLRDGQRGSQDQSILRVFWAILVLECDILAEHHLPRSGIEKIVDKLPYPWSDGPSEPYMHRWLADLSSRRLLNRIHYVLYAEAEPGTGDASADHSEESQSNLPSLAHELNRQLGAWYHLLPHSIRPNLESPPIGIDDTMVTIRYHTTGDIIYRPFLYQVCALAPGTCPNPATLENARQCLVHCRRYLNAVEHAVHAPTACLENFLHGFSLSPHASGQTFQVFEAPSSRPGSSIISTSSPQSLLPFSFEWAFASTLPMAVKEPQSTSGPSKPVSIRFATLADAGRIAELGAYVFTVTFGHSVEPHELDAYLQESYSETSIVKDLQDENKDIIVATNDNIEVLGFSYLTRGSSEPCIEHLEKPVELQRIYVHPSAHGSGVGRHLEKAIVNMAAEQGFKNIWLGVWEENLRALRAYEKWGYTHIGDHDFTVGSVVQTDNIMFKAL